MRSIIEGTDFAACVERLGGYRAIDQALETIIEALSHNPYAFPLIQNDFTAFRYVRTKAIKGIIPPLVLVFTIDDTRNVVLQWVDLDEDAD